MAVLIGANFSFFIPSMTRLIKEYKQKYITHKLKNLVNENENDNKDIKNQ